MPAPNTTASRRLQAQPKRNKDNSVGVLYVVAAGGAVVVATVIWIALSATRSETTVTTPEDAVRIGAVTPSPSPQDAYSGQNQDVPQNEEQVTAQASANAPLDQPHSPESLPRRDGWSWRRYESKAGGYSAEFPRKPAVSDRTGLEVKDPNEKITAFVGIHQRRSESAKADLQRTIDGFGNLPGTTRVSMEFTTFTGHPGAKLINHSFFRGARVSEHVMIVVAPQKTIGMIWICPRDAPATSEPDHFFNSLRITN